MQQPSTSFGFSSPGVNYSIPMTRVELSVSATNLRDKDVMSKSDPVCVAFIKDNIQNRFYELGRTEMIKDCLNPQWINKFEVDYRFEERQMFRFHVYDWDTKTGNTEEQDSLGFMECSLAEIMSRQGTKFRKPLSKGGTLEICGEEVVACKEMAVLTFSAKDLDKKDFFGKSDPFLIFYRVNEGNSFIPVHKTNYFKNTLNPVWPPMRIPVKNLCAGDEDRLIKIACYDWDSDGSHDLIGECETTLKTLKQGSGSTNNYTLINPKKKAKKSSYKGSGTLILNNICIHIEPTFLDYIQGGCQLHFTVAIDFTASNGNPVDPKSLHYLQHGVDNHYSTAIKAVGEVIQDYDSDKLFPALGFGARIPPNGQTSHEFYLNGSTDNPYCQGIEGIFQAYEHSIRTVQLYGPTNFTPVIRHVLNFAKSHQDGNNYFILLIITDGIITDLENTKRALIEASRFPMSVIIVGVGNEDFSAMELLDADDSRLSSNGVYAERDIVQFVGNALTCSATGDMSVSCFGKAHYDLEVFLLDFAELRRHVSRGNQYSKTMLAKDVLAEIPDQFLTWMKSKNHPPKPPPGEEPRNTSV